MSTDSGVDSRVPAPQRPGAARATAWRVVAKTFASAFLLMWAIAYVGVVALFDLAWALNAVRLGDYERIPMLVVLGVLALPGLGLALIGRKRWHFAMLALPLVFLVLACLLPWSERKQFVADLCSVEEGMTVDEVEVVMDRWGYGFGDEYTTRPADWPTGDERASWTGKLSYRWTPGTTLDWGSIRFVDGRVAGVHWSPD